MDWDGKEITNVTKTIENAEELVERDRENHLLRDHHSFEKYFTMLKKQFELLQQILPLVTRLPKKDELSDKIVAFFNDLSNSVHRGNTAIIFLDELKKIQKLFNEQKLPEIQEEFETRASLYQLLFLIEEYLKLKNRFKKSDRSEERRVGKEYRIR